MKRILLLSITFGLICGCSSGPKRAGEPVPTGLETATAVGERTRDTQEKKSTGSMYVTSAANEKPGEPAPAPSEEEAKKLTLVIAMDGSVSQKGQKLETDALNKLFAELPDETQVVLQASSEVPEDRVAEIIKAAHTAGISRVELETDVPASEAPDEEAKPEEPSQDDK